MKSIEEFLLALPQPIQIVGGSPLFWIGDDFQATPEFAISINGLRAGAHAAAINCSRHDAKRVQGWTHVMRPNPQTEQDKDGYMVPTGKYIFTLPCDKPKQPTTYFALLIICQALRLPVELWGICGWASKWHDGDWEMSYIKRMPLVTVHDPRPQW